MLQAIILFFLFAFLAGIFYIFWYQNYSKFAKALNKIPGPKRYPVIGNNLDYLPATPESLFRKALQDFQRFGVIYKKWIVNYGFVFVTHPDDVQIILSGSDHTDKSKIYQVLHIWLTSGLLTSVSSKWQKRRKILTPAFHFTILQEFVPIFNKETMKMVKKIKSLSAEESSLNVMEVVSHFTLLSIARTSMGIKLDSSEEECAKYKEAIRTFGHSVVCRVVRPWLYTDFIFKLTPDGGIAKAAVKVLHNFSRKVIADRKTSFSLDAEKSKKKLTMLDLLLQNYGIDIDDEGIAEEVDTFMFEGHDTIASGITYTLLCLANHPTIQEEVYEEMRTVLGAELKTPSYSDLKELSLMERCIKESLRLFPSVPFISRTSSKEIETSTGYIIPKNTPILTFIFHMHRNPDFFPDPERFDPDRFLPENPQNRHPFSYLPFSAGPRNCIGQKYAMLELKAALCGILKEFVLMPVQRLEDIVFVMDLILKSKQEIKINFCPRKKE